MRAATLMYVMKLKEKIPETGYISSADDDLIVQSGAVVHGHKVLKIIDRMEENDRIIYDILTLQNKKMARCHFILGKDKESNKFKKEAFKCAAAQ